MQGLTTQSANWRKLYQQGTQAQSTTAAAAAAAAFSYIHKNTNTR